MISTDLDVINYINYV